MKKLVRNALVLAAFALTAGFTFAQSNNIEGKAKAAAHDCNQSTYAHGLGLMIKADTYETADCGDGSSSYAVDVYGVGHCPGGLNILCLVIRVDIATVYFDCNGNLSGIVCYE